MVTLFFWKYLTNLFNEEECFCLSTASYYVDLSKFQKNCSKVALKWYFHSVPTHFTRLLLDNKAFCLTRHVQILQENINLFQSCIDYCDNESVLETDMTEFLLKVCGHVQEVATPPSSSSTRFISDIFISEMIDAVYVVNNEVFSAKYCNKPLNSFSVSLCPFHHFSITFLSLYLSINLSV